MIETREQSEQVTRALKSAVSDALDRKRRLGQYAVVYKNGKPVRISGDQLSEQSRD